MNQNKYISLTLYHFFISSEDNIQCIGIVTSNVRWEKGIVIYNDVNTLGHLNQKRRTHVILSNPRKVNQRLGIELLQQVYIADP